MRTSPPTINPNWRNGCERRWWHDAVVYQIYVQSFKDSNGDGMGDLNGILEKLDYLHDLRVGCLWLTPIHESPFVDCGYDPSNQYKINPDFGTVEDFKRLVAEAHKREMRIILDLVPTYTADQHEWFMEGRQSKNAPTHDYYVWGNGQDGRLPNNWYSAPAAAPAWTYNPVTDEYYFHAFLPSQPHLNLGNPRVQDEQLKIAKFWLDQGIDGFRVDAINWCIADDERRDNPGEGFKQVHVFDRNHQTMHQFLKRLRQLSDQYPDQMLVGEVAPGHPAECKEYYGRNHDELHLNFNLQICELIRPHRWYLDDFVPNAKQKIAERVERFTLRDFREAVQTHDLMFRALDIWPTVVVGNHDRLRVASLYGRLVKPENQDKMAKLIAAYTVLSKGTPFIYYGEEIGMEDMIFDHASEFKDTFGIRFYENLVKERKLSPEDALVYAHTVTRDPSRTPMQWDGTLQAGFSSNPKTWLRVHPNFMTRNVQAQLNDPASILNFYKQLIKLRQAHSSLCDGEYVWVDENSNDYLAFLRRGPVETTLVVLNFSECEHELCLDFRPDDISANQLELLASSYPEGPQRWRQSVRIRPVETLVGKLLP